MNKNVAILLATYNGGQYIREQLDSIVAQTYQDWKIYVHDDGSKDDTMCIVRQFMDEYPEKFEIVDGPSTGCARDNFLFLFRFVEADIYMCSDQDDVWIPEKIEITLREMEKINEEVPCLVSTDLKVVDRDLNVIAESMNDFCKFACENVSVQHLLIQNTVTGCTMMVNRALRDLIIKYKNSDNIMMHDWWAAEIAAVKGKLVYLDVPTILYRQHGDNSVGAQKNGISAFCKKINKSERDKIRNTYTESRRQARELCEVLNLEQDSLPYVYSSMESYGRIAKIRTFRKYGFKKNSRFRTFGLYLFG